MLAMHDGKKIQKQNIPFRVLEMRRYWSAVSSLKNLRKICEIIYRTVILL